MLDWGAVGGQLAAPLGVALALGGALGWEREWRQKPAGLRTHMLVSLGSAGVVLGAMRFVGSTGDAGEAGDVIRAVEGVIGGVGFLGAGCIFRAGGAVEGLTTAASLWLAAATGVACGLGELILAAAMVGIGLVVLAGLGALQVRGALPGGTEGDAQR
jgi:putative Mg2+ transporter-C (MgtC) family protein